MTNRLTDIQESKRTENKSVTAVRDRFNQSMQPHRAEKKRPLNRHEPVRNHPGDVTGQRHPEPDHLTLLMSL
jgi:hypothetical protein